MDLSIIIVNWNTCEVTCNCLNSIYENEPSITYEIIVIDNDSSDDSVQAIKNKFPKVLIIENDSNCGFAQANNMGMKKARGEFFLLLNSDTLIIDDVLDKTYRYISNKKDAGIVGCRVLNKDLTMQSTCFMYPSLLNIIISIFYLNKLFSHNIFLGREQISWWNRDSEKVVQTVTGCFMLVKRSNVDLIGYMDDDFFMYAEETDWCYRFEKAGFKNYFSPEGEIIHLGGASTSKVKPKMILQLKSGILQFIKKHKNLTYYYLSCILVSLWFLLRVPYWFMKYLRGNDKDAKVICKVYLKGSIYVYGGYKALSCKGR